MAFTPKNWQDAPSTATPLTATAIEDLETRVTDYTDASAPSLLPTTAHRNRIIHPPHGSTLVPGLEIVGDVSDAAPNLVLGNTTTTKSASGGLAYYRANLQWFVDGVRRWDSALDVGDSQGTGTGSRDGGANTGFADIVPVYRRDPLDSAQSSDFIYIIDERYGRFGFHENTPDAQFHFVKRKAGYPAVIINEGNTPEDDWLLKFQRNATDIGGFYKTETGAWSGALQLRLGSGGAPVEVLDVSGRAMAHAYRLNSGVYTAYEDDETNPLIYGTASGGTYPFTSTANLVLQPRSSTGGTTGDVLIATGDPLSSRIVAFGAKKNVAINPSAAAPLELFGSSGAANGALGLANVVTAPTTGGTGHPTNGAVFWAEASIVQCRVGYGTVGWGQTEAGSGHGGFQAGAADSNTLDVKWWRVAAKVWGTDSIVRYDDAASWQTTVGAAGAASALPATPTKYLKVRDDSGTSLVIPAYVAS